LTRNIYLSCDPYMRGRMGNAKSYASAFALNNPIPARVVAQVQQSDCENFAAGDYVWGFLNWENYTAVSNPQALRRVDPALGPLSHAVSVRGMPGLTAEVGMLELGAARPGDTVFVSAASGAVGSVAGQLAKLAGARVVGSAGSDRKVDHLLHNLGFDAAFNYRKDDTGTALDEFCPNGIDVYFDNVGGATLEAALARINPFARIPVCGQISAYDGGGYPVSNIGAVVAARATLTGFIIYDHMHKFDNFVPRMAERLRSGKVQYVEDIVSGIENTPDAFIGMMRGENLGKRLVKIASENQ
jgi:NADPH-dependent curcumin reductase CurA